MIREVIKQQVKYKISPLSILYSVGGIVSEDEANYLSAYENEIKKKAKKRHKV